MANRLGEEGEGFKFAMRGLNGGRINIASCSLGAAQASIEAALEHTKIRKQFGKPLIANQSVQFKLAGGSGLKFPRLLCALIIPSFLPFVHPFIHSFIHPIHPPIRHDDQPASFSAVGASGRCHAGRQERTSTRLLRHGQAVCHGSLLRGGCLCLNVELSELMRLPLLSLSTAAHCHHHHRPQITNQALQLHGGYGYLKDYKVQQFMRDCRVHQILEGTNEVMRVLISKELMRE